MEDFINALKAEHAALNEQAAALRAQNKGDEAIFCTVRANVYEICATVCAVHMKKGDPAACGALFERFRGEWGAALEEAKRQDNAKKICVEETKLEALRDVTARFAAAGCE
ncbi:MAG: hypothetical protein IK118_05795 [Clostridia bacterium]|nr:hypothetical protein [Clostridia bacterium]MBR5427842.1 hypothetical protein [Clostridia bacterium]